MLENPHFEDLEIFGFRLLDFEARGWYSLLALAPALY